MKHPQSPFNEKVRTWTTDRRSRKKIGCSSQWNINIACKEWIYFHGLQECNHLLIVHALKMMLTYFTCYLTFITHNVINVKYFMLFNI